MQEYWDVEKVDHELAHLFLVSFEYQFLCHQPTRSWPDDASLISFKRRSIRLFVVSIFIHSNHDIYNFWINYIRKNDKLLMVYDDDEEKANDRRLLTLI